MVLSMPTNIRIECKSLTMKDLFANATAEKKIPLQYVSLFWHQLALVCVITIKVSYSWPQILDLS
jgi:hypothetical protein